MIDYRAIKQINSMLPEDKVNMNRPWHKVAEDIIPYEVSLKDIHRYIVGQENRRPVNMFEVGYFCETGDVMVQYGKDMGWFFNYVSTKDWQIFLGDGKPVIMASITGNGHLMQLFRDTRLVGIKTYADLKRNLSEFPPIK